jgi:hypothetical protein
MPFVRIVIAFCTNSCLMTALDAHTLASGAFPAVAVLLVSQHAAGHTVSRSRVVDAGRWLVVPEESAAIADTRLVIVGTLAAEYLDQKKHPLVL